MSNLGAITGAIYTSDNTSAIRNTWETTSFKLAEDNPNSITIANKDPEPYEDWLMRMVILHGVDTAIDNLVYLGFPLSKRMVCDAANHIGLAQGGFMFTDKARRYLDAIEIMRAREQDGRIVGRD